MLVGSEMFLARFSCLSNSLSRVHCRHCRRLLAESQRVCGWHSVDLNRARDTTTQRHVLKQVNVAATSFRFI